MAAAIHDAGMGYQRWELPNVGDEPAPASQAANDLPPQPTVRDLEALEQQAREEGRAAGLAEGRALAQQELLQRLAQFDALCEAAARPLQAMDEQVLRELAQLAMVVAGRVVAHELKLSPELVAHAVREAAGALPAATRELCVRLHPQDLALLQSLGAAEKHWTLQADSALARGDCVLESERSRLDARVESRLAALADAVLGEVDPAHGGEA